MIILMALISLMMFGFSKWNGQGGKQTTDLEEMVGERALTQQEETEMRVALAAMFQDVQIHIHDLQHLANQSANQKQRAYLQQISELQDLSVQIAQAQEMTASELSMNMVRLHEEIKDQLGRLERKTQYLVGR